MIVARGTFDAIVQELSGHSLLALDTETTGLRPWNGDRLFSLMIAYQKMSGAGHAENRVFYFNFQPYEGLGADFVLGRDHLGLLHTKLFSAQDKVWLMHNAKFDMAMLSQEGIEIAGEVYDTLVGARVEHNDHMAYSLDQCLLRIGKYKDDRVEKYIQENKLWTEEIIPGRKEIKKNKHFDRVPFDIIAPYGCSDASETLDLGIALGKSILKQSGEYPPGVASLKDIATLESKLTKVVFEMEKTGVKIDRKYCERAAKYEQDQVEKEASAFKRETGREYQSSPKLFAEVFASEKELWQYTEKGNPSFTSDVIEHFKSPAAQALRNLRGAESRFKFYTGFLYYADRSDVVHPNFNSGGTDTGRFSSSEPNFQNLTSEEGEEEKEFLVRRAIIPRPGFLFIMPDYDQVEYKLMLDYSKMMAVNNFKRKGLAWEEAYFEVANKVRDGFDIHQATADLVGVTRKQAKTLNFGLLYGMGKAKLARALGVAVDEAAQIKARYFAALPYVEYMVSQVQQAIRERGWIRNWAGRKYSFPDRNRAFTGPNKLIQGGAADVLKTAMVNIDRNARAVAWKSRMVLTIHDELPCEIHESEVTWAPKAIQQHMHEAYPYHHIPLTAGMEWSDRSLADKKKGFPV